MQNIKEGNFKFYIIEYQWAATKEPSETEFIPYQAYDADRWSRCSSTCKYRVGVDPVKDWSTLEPEFKKSSDEIRSVEALTGFGSGWWHLHFAVEAIERLRECDRKGMFDVKYRGKVTTNVKHRFRITKINLTMNKKILSDSELSISIR